MTSTISYTRQFFAHKNWTDFVDSIQAGGDNGINIRMHQIEQEFDTLSKVIAQISAGLGAFQPVGAGGAVAYTGGNVGIGANFSSTPPAYRLEVDLAANTATAEQVRFGNAVCCNGAATFQEFAVFAHRDHTKNADYALRQGPAGEVQINAANGQAVSIRQNGIKVRLGISPTGNVVVGGEDNLGGAGTALLQVDGEAFKSTGSASWLVPSDARLKEDVRELEAGLAQLRQVRPVRFRYNGRAGTPAGQEGVGVLGQEIEKIFPEMIRRVPGGLDAEPDTEDLRIYDGSALTFVLVNAVKELAGKVEQLQQTLAESRKEREADGATS